MPYNAMLSNKTRGGGGGEGRLSKVAVAWRLGWASVCLWEVVMVAVVLLGVFFLHLVNCHYLTFALPVLSPNFWGGNE